jgi:hypothetical protein
VQAGDNNSSYYLLTANAFGYDQSGTVTLTVASTQSPAATIAATSTNTAVIAWPASVSGFTVQQNPDLSTTNWVTVTNADNIANGQHQVVVPVTNAKMFYRLKQ